MKNKYTVILFLIISFVSLGQNKFIGTYDRILDFSDTLKNPPVEYENQRRFIIKPDLTYMYTEGQNPKGFSNPYKESFIGSWKANGDTIMFYNKNFVQPKPIAIKYIQNQDFKGIQIIAKDKKGKIQKINYYEGDSLAFDTKSLWTGGVRYREVNKNYIQISDSSHVGIYFQPKGFCNENGICDIYVDLTNIKSGTLIEVSFNSRDIEMRFNGCKYILLGNILQEYILLHERPNPFTDKYIRKK